MLLPLLSGCNLVVLNPAGYIALQQRNIILVSTALMLIIIVPVMILIVAFAWRYRSTNEAATYDPDFDHSTALELVIWSAPLIIIIALGALTWWSTHLLDPFRPLEAIAPNRPVAASVRPLRVEVVSLDWKWLFIYPDQGIATVNDLALPVGVPVRFNMTSTNMMNTFDVPTMAGMVYTMPGMRSQLHAVLNRPVESTGLSGNYSGAGFSDMTFKVHGLAPRDFERWVSSVKASRLPLDYGNFAKLARPSQKVPPIHFAGVEPDLFRRIVERCVDASKPCMSDLMRTRGAAGAHVRQGPHPSSQARAGAPAIAGRDAASPGLAGTGGKKPSAAPAPQEPGKRDMSSNFQLREPGPAGVREPLNA